MRTAPKKKNMMLPMRSVAGRHLRVGLLLDGLVVPAWMRLMIERVRATGCASIVLAVVGSTDQTTPRGLAAKTRAMLERLAVEPEIRAGDAFEQLDVSTELTGVTVLQAARHSVGDSTAEYDAAELGEIEAHNLDLLVDLGSVRLGGGILSAARHGVWSYSNVDALAGFWEYAEGCPEIRTSLEIVTPAGAKTLYESASSIERTSVSTSRNRAYWKAASFVPRALEALYREGAEAFTRRTAALPAAPPPDRRRPGIAKLAVVAGTRFVEQRRSRMLRRLSREQWFLLYAFGATPPRDYRSFKSLIPPKDRFWADPHIVMRDGRHYVFFEEYLYATDRAHISVLTIDASGEVGPPVPIIERPYHLSYPHIFNWRGDYYLVPESKQNRTIEVYRCTEFPHRWQLATVLMDNVAAVDATLLEHGGRWWLFANMVENAGVSSWDELFLFSADSPLSRNWTPHPLNPIVSDVKRSRPAGPIFTRNGRFFRPSQNSARRYGHSFNISEITELTLTSYQERLVETVEPNWDPSIFATHSFASEHGLTVIDGMKRFWRWPLSRYRRGLRPTKYAPHTSGERVQ